MISEGSCDTEDWRNDAGNSDLTSKEYISIYIQIEKIALFHKNLFLQFFFFNSSVNTINFSLMGDSYQTVQIGVLTEESLAFFLLVSHKVLDIHIEAGRGHALRALSGLLAFLKEQRQQREQGVSDSQQTRHLHINPQTRSSKTRHKELPVNGRLVDLHRSLWLRRCWAALLFLSLLLFLHLSRRRPSHLHLHGTEDVWRCMRKLAVSSGMPAGGNVRVWAALRNTASLSQTLRADMGFQSM